MSVSKYPALPAGSTLNVATYNARGNGTTDDTTAIQACLNAAPLNGTVLFPPGAYRITAALTVPRSMRIVGAAPGVEIRQETYPKPAFDILDVNDVRIENLFLNYTGATRDSTLAGGFYRGDLGYNYSAGVWANGSHIRVDNCRVRRFTTGVYLSPWNSATSNLTAGGTNNRVTNIECDTNDFGVLFLGQSDLQISGITAHDITDSSAGANPTHAVYGSGNTSLKNYRVQIADIVCYNALTGHAVQLKYTVGGSVNNILADTCSGVFNGIDLIDVSFDNHLGRGITYNTGDAAWVLQEVTTNSFCTASNITLHMTGYANGTALVIIGDDNRIINITIHASRDGTYVNSAWECDFRGNRFQADNLRINGIGTGRSRAIDIGYNRTTTDAVIRGLVCRNTQNLVDVEGGATNLTISYDPAEQTAMGLAASSWVAVAGGTPTYTVLTKQPATPNPPSGQYFCPVSSALLQTSIAHGANSLRATPWLVPTTIPLSRIAMEVSTAGSAGSLMRLGIYNDNGNGQPGALLLDAGTVDTSSTGTKEATISITLQPGLYWLAGALQGTLTTAPTITCCGTGYQPAVPCTLGTTLPAAATQAQGYSSSATVSGALPNPFTGPGAAGLIFRPMLKVA